MDIWYVPKDGYGHTSDPELAMTDKTGAPVISPGPLSALLREQRRNLELAWERLLDAMEALYELQDQKPRTMQESAGLTMKAEEAEASIKGMRMILALLEYGMKAQELPETYEYRIEREADRRYEQSSEG